MFKKIAILSFVLFSVVILSGCMSNQEKMDLDNRLEALEEKSNEAMRTANAAQVDASTALHISVENQEKLK